MLNSFSVEMVKFILSQTILLISCVGLIAGDHFVSSAVIIASIEHQAPNQREDPSLYREYLAEREVVYKKYRSICAPDIGICDSSLGISRDNDDFRPGYWVVWRSIKHLGNISVYNDIYPECAQDGYVVEIHVGGPLMPEICNWAMENDQQLAIETGCSELTASVLGRFDEIDSESVQ